MGPSIQVPLAGRTDAGAAEAMLELIRSDAFGRVGGPIREAGCKVQEKRQQ